MAIFIALIFQVLFVFFAMTINIGLLVHDKINLQNSADLAAYYGAQRQAEILNAIAHTNYQIRQSWKLLAWRVRALGDSGRATHPWRTGDFQEGRISLQVGEGEDYPSICTNHNFWKETSISKRQSSPENQNACHTPTGLEIPELQPIRYIPGAPGAVVNLAVQLLTADLREGQQDICSDYGVTNWLVGAIWLAQYKKDVAFKKQAINSLAQRLSESSRDFRDLNEESALRGVQQTLINNLTRSNREGLEDVSSIEFFNSLGGQSYKTWLNEIPIYPYIYYSDFAAFSDSGSGNTCNTRRKPLNFAQENEVNESLPQLYRMPAGEPYRPAIDSLRQFVYGPNDVNSLVHPIAGVEKNPWMMAYVGVRVTSRPRKPFAPFGEPIQLTAKAYAKPFGGRIGPWMFRFWPQDSQTSSGTTEDLVDKLLPPVAGVQIDPDTGQDRLIPNYSRYPGDDLGLRSKRAVGATFHQNIPNQKVSYHHYNVDDIEAGGPKILAYDIENQVRPFIGNLEIAAIAPDVFDITYYSIEPRWLYNYRSQFQPAAPLLAHDFGLRGDNNFTVASQIQTVSGLLDLNLAGWMVANWRNLLTGWVPNAANNYDQLNPQAFGHCDPNGEGNIPGNCQIGGRVGYSVKIISKAFLNRPDLPLGGSPSIRGSIRNQPPW